MIRVVQAGLGGFGRTWAPLVQEAPGFELAGVVDPSPAARRFARDELGLPVRACFTSLEAALAHPSDAVLLVTPPATHLSMGVAALAAGRHVLIEKPLAPTLAEAKALVAAGRRARRHVIVDQNYRYRRPARAVQSLVGSGALGELVAVRIEFRRDVSAFLPRRDFRYQMAHPLLLDQAIHQFDLLRAVTGQEVVEADARSWPLPGTPFRYEGEAAALLRLSGGATVVYSGSWAPSGRETSFDGDWELLGEAGRVTWTGSTRDSMAGTVTLLRQGRPPERVPQPRLRFIDRLGVLQSLRAAVEQGEPAETAAADNVRSLAIVLACVESSECGRPVAL